MPEGMERPILTVSQLNNYVRNRMEEDGLLQNLSVQGELSNYKLYPSGHHYFTLKDAGGALRCIMFRSSAASLRFRPENGMRVTAFGRVGVYPRDGIYQLYCSSLLPQGLGDLHAAFARLKQKLEAEGLFDPDHKRPLPRFPSRIAVITSGAGAAVRDIIRVAGRRWPLAKLLILPVRVQGAEAPAEIVGALRYANRWAVADLIITGRGGGSMEDLWAFNDETVARAIYESRIPVISAVGHEPDVTISDYVADRRAATPSNAAELALPEAEELREWLYSVWEHCEQGMTARLVQARTRLEGLRSRRVLASPLAYVELRRMELDRLRERLLHRQEARLDRERRRMAGACASLEALSPLNVLARGYAVAMLPEGTILRDAADLVPGAPLRLRLSRGALDCRVERVYRESGPAVLEEGGDGGGKEEGTWL